MLKEPDWTQIHIVRTAAQIVILLREVLTLFQEPAQGCLLEYFKTNYISGDSGPLIA